VERGLVRLKILVTGGSSGVGQAVVKLLDSDHLVVAPTRLDLDLANFDQIDQVDLSEYDVVINCAGANAGAYQGWQNNSWQNQKTQVDVNFTGALLLAKQYTRHRKHGQFVYVTSNNIDDPIAYNIFYTASKSALRYSINTLRRECPGIVFTEVCPGKIKSNMLAQNYQGSKTEAEIEELYTNGPVLYPIDIAIQVEHAIKYKLDQITISPYEKTSI
jgi:NADP-dependent 3-hydroxy acid dehydrogenase YdfG